MVDEATPAPSMSHRMSRQKDDDILAFGATLFLRVSPTLRIVAFAMMTFPLAYASSLSSEDYHLRIDSLLARLE